MKLIIPSKIILFGEHSIVYPGNSAIITSLGLFTEINTKSNTFNKVKLNIFTSDSNQTLNFDLEDAINIYNQAEDLFKKFKLSNDIKFLKELMSKNLGAYKIIFGFVASSIKLSGIEMDIHIKAPIGSGMGTSASISAGIIKSLFEFSNIKLSNEDLFTLTKKIEDFQHGNSSGIDPAGVINGGILEFSHTKNGLRKFKYINPKTDWDKNLYLIYSGKPEQSTGEMVNIVRELHSKNKSEVESIFNSINKISNDFKDNNYNDLGELIDKNGKLLEKINIVSENVIRYSNKIRSFGGFIKVCGAGGNLGNTSGLLLCKIDDIKKLEEINQEFGFKIINAKFNVPGIKLSN